MLQRLQPHWRLQLLISCLCLRLDDYIFLGCGSNKLDTSSASSHQIRSVWASGVKIDRHPDLYAGVQTLNSTSRGRAHCIRGSMSLLAAPQVPCCNAVLW